MKILLSGGGTLGPVSPLLAIYETYSKHNPDCEFIWIGTKSGPEKEVVESYQIPFFVITCGKLRRYLSWRNIIDIFKFIIGFFQSIIVLIYEKPNLLITAGGFVSVPLHLAALFLGIPTWVHQQDVQVGLANKIMAKIASKVTTALEKNLSNFSAKKTEWLGNPVRDLATKNKVNSRKKLSLEVDKFTILVFGGGTGSDSINKLVIDALPHLPKDCQLIHLTGKERSDKKAVEATKTFDNYHVFKFLNSEMKDAYAAADVVLGRGGFVTISELAALAKPAILMPMSNTHQEENVKLLAKERCAIIFDQKNITGLDFAKTIKDLINRPDVLKYLGDKLQSVLPPAKEEKIVGIINNLNKDV